MGRLQEAERDNRPDVEVVRHTLVRSTLTMIRRYPVLFAIGLSALAWTPIVLAICYL